MLPTVDELPKQGPFEVQQRALRVSTLGHSALALFILALGVGLVAYGWYQGAEVWRVQSVWAASEIVDEDPMYEGEVTTRNFVFNEYELEVTYTHPTAGLTTVEADFFTFFSGPDENTPIYVKAMPDDPTVAVLNWQAESWIHGSVWALIIAGMGGMMLFLGGVLLSGLFNVYNAVFELARSGELTCAKVTDMNATTTSGVTTVLLTMELNGRPHAANYQQGSTDPTFYGEDKVLVLASRDGLRMHMLRADGYPLQLGGPRS
jgi:hypothetical protein